MNKIQTHTYTLDELIALQEQENVLAVEMAHEIELETFGNSIEVSTLISNY